MKDLRDDIRLAIAGDAPVLISGEPGVGTAGVARYIHEHGPRHGAPFVTMTCAARPDAWLLAELFGGRSVTASGLERSGGGRLQQAGSGSLLIHEVGELGLPVQERLVDILESVQDTPRRRDRARAPLSVRLIATTSGRLIERVEDKTFLADLFYRLNTVHICVPPLRARREDIPVLIERCVAAVKPRPEQTIGPAAMVCLQAYDWPGNLRELRLVLGALVTSGHNRPVEPSDLPPAVRRAGNRTSGFERTSPDSTQPPLSRVSQQTTMSLHQH